ncbi:MAG: AAA family ATPase [Candidatus Omnitrophica bacterium]|nr:AAA family ATPase [Candidatus Omnitrophota bacterium]
MRIDQLTVQHCKKFAEQTFTLHPQFTLLVGENGSGKTAVLDALAVSFRCYGKMRCSAALLHFYGLLAEFEDKLEGITGDAVACLQ